jgi:hypothetical protein
VVQKVQEIAVSDQRSAKPGFTAKDAKRRKDFSREYTRNTRIGSKGDLIRVVRVDSRLICFSAFPLRPSHFKELTRVSKIQDLYQGPALVGP